MEKDLLEKAITIKRLEYSLLGKELKKQTSIAEKQHQKLDNTSEFDKIIIIIIIIIKQNKKDNRSNLI